MPQITQKQLKELIENRPPGTRPQALVKGLVDKGYDIEGFVPQENAITIKPQIFGRQFLEDHRDILTGFAKGVGSTILGGAQLLTRGLEKAGVVPEGRATETETAKALREVVTPTTEVQERAFTAEQIGEFFIPIGGQARLASKAPRLLKTLGASEKLQTVAGVASRIGLDITDFVGREAVQRGKLRDVVSAASLTGLLSLGGQIIAGSGGKLIDSARRLYQSALKPSITKKTVKDIPEVVETGLKEGIVLSKAGIQKTEDLIDDLLEELTLKIDEAGLASETVKTAPLKGFIDDAKKILANTVDVARSKAAAVDLDRMFNNFVKKFGDEIPIQKAQELKVNTGVIIKKAYGELSTPVLEGNKALVRGLKEGIIKAAPVVGDINKRLTNLFKFETELNRARSRIGNLNIFSLTGKALGTATGLATGSVKVAAAVAIVSQLAGSPNFKSFTAIQLNRIGNQLAKLSPPEKASLLRQLSGRIPPAALAQLRRLTDSTGRLEEESLAR